MDTITITRGPQAWMATFSGQKGAELKRHFGQATIPTPFRATCPAETVLREIGQRNPNAAVRLG